ncbi:TRAP transporter small permease subunit [Elioraea tepidiphila]|uniref:TRAP transporter small permease n=1 Tax=Elioraea tepidiphila TaxID=457934 RepID=UPI002FDB8D2F
MIAARAARRLLGRLLDITAALLLLGVLAVTVAQVTARYLLGVPMPWGEELTRLLFVWLVLIAASRARHMRIELVSDRTPPWLARVLRWFAAALAVALLGLLAWKGLGLIELTAYDRYTALGVSLQYLYAAVVTGAALWIVTILLDLVLGPDEDRSGP